MKKEEALLEELSKQRKNIKTDNYSMSVGEIINLYKEKELKLNPAFKRLFKWDDEQKTKFIESILLGIPIPEIFVAQRSDGKWDIVDGVQRISTLLQLTGDLEDYKPLILRETTYLPSLEDFTWEQLPAEVKRILRRAKLGINIILTEDSVQSQYELFQRLNTGGLHLEDQEIRNCLLIMINNDFYEKINELKEYPQYKGCLCLKEDRFKEEYHMELIIRYLISKIDIVKYDEYNSSKDMLADFLDKEIARVIQSDEFDMAKEIDIFKRTFDYLFGALKDDIFRMFNKDKGKFEGAFSVTSFEAIVPGVATNIDIVTKLTNEEFIEKIKELYQQEEYIKCTNRGVKALTRVRGLTSFSKEYFKK